MRPVGNNKPKLIIAHLFGSLVLLSFIWTIATGLVPLSFGEVSRSMAVAGEGKSSGKTPAAQALTPPQAPRMFSRGALEVLGQNCPLGLAEGHEEQTCI